MALLMMIAFTSLQGFVTKLAARTPSQVVSIDQKRWAIEVVNWERGLGLG
jgi:hypothetical protein